MKLLYPDSLYDLDSISCSIFMYFQDDPFGCTLHPTVSMPLTDCNPTDFLEFINKKNPSWIKSYWMLYNNWIESSHKIHKTSTILKPIQDENLLKSVWLIYPKNEGVIEKTKELIAKLGFDYKTLLNFINIEHAFQELMAHIHFEMFLEIYGGPTDKSTTEFTPRNLDYTKLYNYCDNFFNKYSLEEALVNTYFLRLTSRQKLDNIMLSNERLIPFLSQINSNDKKSNEKTLEYNKQIDIVSWEIFRQLLSPYIDKMEQSKRIDLTTTFIKKRNEEIKKLQNKCWSLAEDFKGENSLDKLKSNITKHISVYVESEIKDLLQIDKKSFIELKDKIFSDEKTWIGISSFIISTFTGGELLTAGAAILTLSNLLAKTYKTHQETQEKIKQSDYSLIYRIRNY